MPNKNVGGSAAQASGAAAPAGEVASVGVSRPAAGPPQGGTAPSGGSEPRAAGSVGVSLYGDARAGRFADNLTGFARALRRAGLPLDASRMALAAQAVQVVGVGPREDFSAALEAVLVTRAADRAVFREVFDVVFRDPQVAHRLLAQMLPRAPAEAKDRIKRPRVRAALTLPKPGLPPAAKPHEEKFDVDAAMTASDLQRLRQADFNALSGAEYHLVQRLARDIALPVPHVPGRRTRVARRGTEPHWPRLVRHAGQTGGEVARLVFRRRQPEALPLLVLVDVSGSMERYARLLLAFLHAATAHLRRRDVFAFGTELTDLRAAFALGDTDAMLEAASAQVLDYAGGTRLGASLAQLRRQHARRLSGRRTLVLLISDGLDTGTPETLAQELDWLRRHSRRLLWLNPLMRYDGYQPLAQGAAVLHQRAHGMLAVHNLNHLQQLAQAIAALMRA